MMLILTNRCNQRCKFCAVRKENEGFFDLELDRIEIFLKKYKARLNDIHLMGGEPTLYPHFKDLLEIFPKYELDNIVLVSNGHSLNDAQWVSYLIQHNVTQFILSFHDTDEDILSLQTGNKNSFRNINNAISTILSVGGNVKVNVVITALNYNRIREISEYLYSIGIRTINFSFVIPPVHIKYDFDSLIPRYTEMYPYLEDALDYLESNDVIYNIQYIPYCILKKHRDKRMSSYVDEFYCVDYNQRGYSHPNDCTDHISVKAESCSICSYNDKCLGVFKDYVARLGWGEFKPVVV